jgi:hypothetical protein
MKSKHNSLRSILMLLPGLAFLIFAWPANAQLIDYENLSATNIDISATHLQFHVDQGKTQSQSVVITNNSDEVQRFRANYQDFELSTEGESTFLKAGSSEHSLAGKLNISPRVMEVGPWETAEVQLTVSIPGDDESPESAWGVVMIEQEGPVHENKLEENSLYPEKTLTSEYAYGIWLYQNPPEAEDTRIDITNFIVGNKARNKGVFLKLKNKSDAVSICNAYVEITNLATGELITIEGKQYTLLPGSRRTLLFELEETLPKGSYSAVGVIDYNNHEELVATELEFKID